jgi:hypothetical protein
MEIFLINSNISQHFTQKNDSPPRGGAVERKDKEFIKKAATIRETIHKGKEIR